MAEPGKQEYEFIDKPTFYLHEATSFLAGVRDELIVKFTSGLLNPGWSGQNLLEAFEEKFESRTGGLVSAAKIVKGEKLTIALNTDQILPFYALYDLSSLEFSMGKITCSVCIDSTEPGQKITRADLIWYSRPGIPDDVLISKALAKTLGTTDGQNIIIWEATKDESDVDLDK